MAIITDIAGMKINSSLTVETIDNTTPTIKNNVFSIITATPTSINVNVPNNEICNAICQFTASSNANMPTLTYNNTESFKMNAGSVSTVTMGKTYQISFLNDCCTIAEFNELS